MTERNYSLNGLNKFLDYASDKGLMKKETAAGRKRAANQILGILDEHELMDLRKIDVEAVSHRFANLQGSNFKPSSLQIYISRTKSAVQDFITYVDNPISFRPSINQRGATGSPSPKKGSKKQSALKSEDSATNNNASEHQSTERKTHGHHANSGNSVSTLVFPIPIRPEVIVNVSNIPADLTEAEAAKIASVIKALATLSG